MGDTGVCDSGNCATGYAVNSGTKLCEAKCFGKQGMSAGCDNGGECVAPNYCICGKSGAQVVGVLGNYTTTSGKLVEGTQASALEKTESKVLSSLSLSWSFQSDF